MEPIKTPITTARAIIKIPKESILIKFLDFFVISFSSFNSNLLFSSSTFTFNILGNICTKRITPTTPKI